MAAHADSQARVAPANNPYAQRLAVITRGLEEDNGLRLNYKVHLEDTINAFVTPDGSVRFYSGLMDAFTDDEIRFVIGHEIGHVAHNHQKKRMQTALAASAARDAAASSGNGNVAQLASSSTRRATSAMPTTTAWSSWRASATTARPRSARSTSWRRWAATRPG
jgi:putative metalloprotease